MKTSFLIAAILISTFLQTTAFAAETSVYRPDSAAAPNLSKTGDFGLGVKWGNLTGVTGKYWLTEMHAIDATVAFDNGNTAVGLDYLWHFREAAADVSSGARAHNFVPYLGAGLISAFGSNTNFFNTHTDNFGLALRIPVGIEYLPDVASLGVFAEVAPGFGIIPTNYTFLSADLGARYYF
jgi:hypothetical protein